MSMRDTFFAPSGAVPAAAARGWRWWRDIPPVAARMHRW
jgi:hypothetical protein